MLLKPYKSIGLFADESQFQIYSAGTKQFMAVPTNHSYKVLSLPDLKVVLQGPHFRGKVRQICGWNEFVFVAEQKSVHKMRYYHEIECYQFDEKVRKTLILGNFLLVGTADQQIFVIAHQSSKKLSTIAPSFPFRDIIHPPTYLNKILVYGARNMEIWNIQTRKLIYQFERTLQEVFKLEERSASIELVENSPVLDVVAVALSNVNQIYLFNIRQDQVVHQFRISNKPCSLSFSKIYYPYLAVGDEKGQIIVWDLNEKKILSQIKEAHSAAVTCLRFLDSEQMFISSCAQQNAIKQWRYEEYEESRFIVIRERRGLLCPIKRLRFTDEENFHILAISSSQEAEIRDFSLLNECMSINFSLKKQGKASLISQHTYTEQNTASVIAEASSFGFSMNRVKDWANVLTSHKFSEKACIWNSEDHTIVKQNLEYFEDEAERQRLEGCVISCVFVSACGNFGVIGYDNGRIIKINMQSGKFQKEFKCHTEQAKAGAIMDLFVNHYNKYLVSADSQGRMIISDFFAAIKLFETSFAPHAVTLIRGAKHSQHYLVALSDFSLEVWDMFNFRRGRRFTGHTQKILDACFTNSNKYILSCAQDKTVKVWDILGNVLIYNFQSNRIIHTLDVSADGQYVATAFQGSREIQLWHNMIEMSSFSSLDLQAVPFQSEVQKTFANDRVRFYAKDRQKVGS